MVGVPLTEGMQRNYYGAARAERSCDGRWEPGAGGGAAGAGIGELAEARDIADPGRLNDAASWDLHLSAEERESAAQAIGAEVLAVESIAVSVGTKVQAKDWGQENWRALLGKMAAELSGAGAAVAGSGGGERGE